MDWKNEIKKKLEEHAQKKQDRADPSGQAEEQQSSHPPPGEARDAQDLEPPRSPERSEEATDAQGDSDSGWESPDPEQSPLPPPAMTDPGTDSPSQDSARTPEDDRPGDAAVQDEEVTVSLGKRPTVRMRPTTFLRDQGLQLDVPPKKELGDLWRSQDSGQQEEPPTETAAEADAERIQEESADVPPPPEASGLENPHNADAPGEESERIEEQLEQLFARQEASEHPAEDQEERASSWLSADEPDSGEDGVAEEDMPGSGEAEPAPDEAAQEPLQDEAGDPSDSPLQLELLERDLAPAAKKEEPEDRQRSIVTFEERSQAEPSPLDRPLRAREEDEPDGSEIWKAAFSTPDQDDSSDPDSSPYADDFPDEDLEEADELWVPREIFISRSLAGLIDLLLAAFTGLLFAAGASRVLGFGLLAPATLQLAGGLALIFFIACSVFFLRLSSQTPGMHLAKLKVLHQESAEVSTGAALIRVLAFLPSFGLLFAGLLWGLFDPWARCLHDRLSQTRVVVSDRG